ncbi:MAG: hypothetical protein IMF11_01355, partial [Proteobacteria bacterium]|nr:hypothetical protein [Pseudomonadota bacterium]
WVRADDRYRRVIAAFYYYRQAERLAALEPDRQAMVAEVVLNLTKALEIIFSSDRDQLRFRASRWGFDTNLVEEKIIPLFLLRNQMDVAHVATGPLTPDQKQVVLNFTDIAFSHVHDVLKRVAELVRSGEIELDPISRSLDKDKEELIQTLKKYSG